MNTLPTTAKVPTAYDLYVQAIASADEEMSSRRDDSFSVLGDGDLRPHKRAFNVALRAKHEQRSALATQMRIQSLTLS